MATSGTTTFESGFAIDDIIQEAYDRVGIRSVSGYQLKSARRSLNIMFQEWANRGLHYWEIDKTNVNLLRVKQNTNFSGVLMMAQVQLRHQQMVYTALMIF